ncbi:MAG: ATP-binding protein [Chloroflexi bacterium]|nr:ATP-binding protein [Chloroflexota bacterium]
MNESLQSNLSYLGLTAIHSRYDELERLALKKKLSPAAFFEELVAEEASARRERSVRRRIKAARFPAIKTLDDFRWAPPLVIDRELVQHLFTLKFLEKHHNASFLGGNGVGKTHLLIALGHHACQKGYNVRFESAIKIINTLKNAQLTDNFLRVMKGYTSPELLCIDELGFLPIDQEGGNLLFQVISERYETGSTAITSNLAYQDWPKVFNRDKTLVSAMLDRLLHHCDSIIMEGPSFRTER